VKFLEQRTVPFDQNVQNDRSCQTAKMIKEKMNPEGLKLLESYSHGVNFYLEKRKINILLSLMCLLSTGGMET